MSVTLTRRQVIALGERAIARATSNVTISCAPALDRDPEVAKEAPEVEAFRQVIATGTSFAVGTTRTSAGVCPMAQTVFGFPNEEAVMITRLAYAWDDTFTEDGGAMAEVNVVHVNPLTN